MKILCSILSLVLLLNVQIKVNAQLFDIEWQNCFGGTDTEYPRDIIAVSDGYLVTGYTKSFNGNISFNHGLTDIWVFKTDITGMLIWEKTFGGSYGDNADRILSDGQGNYYIVGATDSDDGDVSFDPYPNSWDFWIIKFDTTGSLIWEKVLGGSGSDVMWTATLTNDGGIIAFGWTTSNDGDISINYGGYDMWMVKLNSDGEKEWDFSIGTDGFDFGQAIMETSDGGFLVGGSSAIGNGGNLICEPFNYNTEAILVKLDEDRNIVWQQCYGGSETDGITALAKISDGYVFGAYVNSNDGDISGWHGDNDIWVVRTDTLGNIIWQKCLGGSWSEFTAKLIVTEDEDILISGFTQSIDGDVTGNHTVSEHEYDIWIVKLNNEGELIWEQCFGGIWDEQVNFGFIQKGDNNFVIAGQTDYGPSYDVACTPHGGNYDKDFWVFEITDTTTNVVVNETGNPMINVYPNPANDFVVFELNDKPLYRNQPDNMEISIFNFFGQEFKNLNIYTSGNKYIWDTRMIQNGIYFYSLEIEGMKHSGKIVVQK